MNPQQNKSVDLKLVMLGQQGVGKTCIAVRFVTNTFNIATISTAGASFLRKSFVVDGTAYRFQIWDTAGQESFRSLTSMYYRGANAAIMVFDVTKASSFEEVKFWVKEIKMKGAEDTQIAIVGNKIDKASARQVSQASALQYAELIDASYSEVSALTGQGILEVFVTLAKKCTPQPSPHPIVPQPNDVVDSKNLNDPKKKDSKTKNNNNNNKNGKKRKCMIM